MRRASRPLVGRITSPVEVLFAGHAGARPAVVASPALTTAPGSEPGASAPFARRDAHPATGGRDRVGRLALDTRAAVGLAFGAYEGYSGTIMVSLASRHMRLNGTLTGQLLSGADERRSVTVDITTEMKQDPSHPHWTADETGRLHRPRPARPRLGPVEVIRQVVDQASDYRLCQFTRNSQVEITHAYTRERDRYVHYRYVELGDLPSLGDYVSGQWTRR